MADYLNSQMREIKMVEAVMRLLGRGPLSDHPLIQISEFPVENYGIVKLQ